MVRRSPQPSRFAPALGVLLLTLPASLLVGMPRALVAQEDSLGGALAAVEAVDRVRLEMKGRPAPLEGRLAFRDERSLTLRLDESELRQIDRSEVVRLWLPDGHHGAEGAVLGALVVGGLGAAAGALAVSISEGDPGISGEQAAVVLGLPGAIVGAGAGYLIGRRSPEWSLRFEAGDTGGRVGFAIGLELR